MVVDREGLGRSRGGLGTKVHLLADDRCRPLARISTAGQGLVAQHPVGSGPRAAGPTSRDPQTSHERVEGQRVVALA